MGDSGMNIRHLLKSLLPMFTIDGDVLVLSSSWNWKISGLRSR